MSAGDGEPVDFPWFEIAVNAVVYIAGVYLFLTMLGIDISQLRTQPQRILMVIFLVPLVPVLILLALTGRIRGLSIGGFVEVIFGEPSGERPSSGRRSVLKVGLFMAVIAVLGSLIENFLKYPKGSLPDGQSTDRPTDTPAQTATSAPEETTSAPEETTSAPEDDYGEQAYGQYDYGG